MNRTVQSLALDLTQAYPRSPRETLGGYVVAARALDKCRAVIAGTNGEYHFDCPLDRQFFDFTGIDSTAFKAFVEIGANDAAVADWIGEHTKIEDRTAVIQWNNNLRYTRPVDMPAELQLFLEDYIAENVPKGRPVYVWFDVYDLEEKRM